MAFQGDSIFWVEVGKIVPNPFQPRREFNEDKLKELAESVRMYGILQPLTVTKKEIQTEDGAFYSEYELIAGERRLRASKIAGLEQVPVIIRSGEDTEQEKLELAIIENLQREDLNAVDRAMAFKQLAGVFDLSHAQVAKKVGRSREYVSNTIRLLLLPDYMLSSLQVGDISEGHARSLLMLKDRPEEQDVVYREILLKKLSVREVERISRKIASDKVRKKAWIGTDPELIEIEREFTDTLGTRVQISKTDFGGKLTIDYFSDADLQKLLLIVKSQGKITDVHQKEQSHKNDDFVSEPVMDSPQSVVMAKIAETTPLDVVHDEFQNNVPQLQPQPQPQPQPQQDQQTEAHKSDSILDKEDEESSVENMINELAEKEAEAEVNEASSPISVAQEQTDAVSVQDTVADTFEPQDKINEVFSAEDDPSVLPRKSEYITEVKKEDSTIEEIETDEEEKANLNSVEDTNDNGESKDDLYSIKNFSL